MAYLGLAAQKNGYSLYLNCVHSRPAAEQVLHDAYARAGVKLDMDKSCLRFKALDGLLLDEVARIVASTPVDAFIAAYQRARASEGRRC